MQKQDVQGWIKQGITPDTVSSAERFGRDIQANGLSTSQIRQVFTKLKSIEAKGYEHNKVGFLMLKPMLAYAAGRDRNKKGLQEFQEKITWAIDAVVEGNDGEQSMRFNNFCKFFESVLAYHRAAGGK